MLGGRRVLCLLMRASAAKHVGVKVVPTEVAHQKRSHAAFRRARQRTALLGTTRWPRMRRSDGAGGRRAGRSGGFAGKAVSMV